MENPRIFKLKDEVLGRGWVVGDFKDGVCTDGYLFTVSFSHPADIPFYDHYAIIGPRIEHMDFRERFQLEVKDPKVVSDVVAQLSY